MPPSTCSSRCPRRGTHGDAGRGAAGAARRLRTRSVLPSLHHPAVRGAALAVQDPPATEWTVVVLGAHTSAALMARHLGDTGADGDRQFEFVVSYDRALVTAAAHSMVARLNIG
jgi:hypothetical protein